MARKAFNLYRLSMSKNFYRMNPVKYFIGWLKLKIKDAREI